MFTLLTFNLTTAQGIIVNAIFSAIVIIIMILTYRHTITKSIIDKIDSKATKTDLDELKKEVKDKMNRTEFLTYIDMIKLHIDSGNEENRALFDMFQSQHLKLHEKQDEHVNQSFIIIQNTIKDFFKALKEDVKNGNKKTGREKRY